jgi:hypothetical protein
MEEEKLIFAVSTAVHWMINGTRDMKFTSFKNVRPTNENGSKETNTRSMGNSLSHIVTVADGATAGSL